jgi:uncharacterized protein YaaN involved in tellurite resistance
MSDLIKRDAHQAVDLATLAPEEQKRAAAIAEQINVSDSQALIQYGVGAQSKISGFADNMLTQLRAKDSGYVGDVLTNLVVKIKEVDAGSLTGKGGLLGGLLGNLAGAFKRFIARYEKLSVQIEKIIDELDAARMTLLKDITLLDGLYAKNLDYLKELDIYIAAGQMKLAELREKTLPELQARAEASRDPMDAQRLQDFNQFLDRFDKKLYDLKLTRMVSIQTAPQVRLIQNSDQLLVEKIQSSILNTIPLWKNQIVIAISLFRQKKALDLQKEVTKTTNDLLTKNSEMLKQGTIEVARESERGIVEIETLQKVNTDLISTIEETLRIQGEGRTKRQQAEGELARMEGELKARLVAIKGE